MKPEEPEPLWRDVVGDTEPWRRGRVFLVALGIWTLLTQLLLVGSAIFVGRVEVVLAAGAGALVWWLLFYCIWVGVHWVRWLSAFLSGFVAFANLIWGILYGNPIRLIDGALGLPIAAYLGLAPSVYFFALRQKETVRWKESLAVAAVFALLLVSFGTGLVTLARYKSHLETRAHAFADRTFRRVFVDGDSEFLKNHATARLMQEEGWDRLSLFMADRYMKLGVASEIRPARGPLRFWFRFPSTLLSEGQMSAFAMSEHGPVRFDARVGRASGDWEIDAIWWRFVDPAAVPRD